MRIEGRRYRDEWLPNFYPSRKIGDSFVRISRTGKSQLLTADEDAQINEFFMDAGLFDRLERTGHIITKNNSGAVMEGLKTWLKGTYDGPQLHIVVATKRCNLNCTYCHMNPEPASASKSLYDLQPDISRDIIRFILQSPNPILQIEFQGGEAFLNFQGMMHFVEETKKANKAIGKDIRWAVVSNLMVATDEQLAYCYDNGIQVSYTLNGPREIHDTFRISRNGKGSYDAVMRRMDQIKSKFPGLLSTAPLCVITSDNAKDIQTMLDFYYELGFRDLGMLYLKNLGNAVRNRLQFDVRDFINYYIKVLDYIYEKNKTLKEAYRERLVQVALMKILSPTDVPFVDWRNPVGYVSNSIVYDYDGEILPVDEARSLRQVFSLGNVRNTSYDELIRNKETFKTVNLSLRDRDAECRECAYNPYCGVSPVLHYAKTGDLNPRAYESDECFLVLAILDWVFKKFLEDPIPLVRMVPELTPHLINMVARQKSEATGIASNG